MKKWQLLRQTFNALQSGQVDVVSSNGKAAVRVTQMLGNTSVLMVMTTSDVAGFKSTEIQLVLEHDRAEIGTKDGFMKAFAYEDLGRLEESAVQMAQSGNTCYDIKLCSPMHRAITYFSTKLLELERTN